MLQLLPLPLRLPLLLALITVLFISVSSSLRVSAQAGCIFIENGLNYNASICPSAAGLTPPAQTNPVIISPGGNYDDGWATATLPFNFHMYGLPYDYVNINVNGIGQSYQKEKNRTNTEEDPIQSTRETIASYAMRCLGCRSFMISCSTSLSFLCVWMFSSDCPSDIWHN